MTKEGFPLADFHGFMCDGAQKHWRAIITIYNGGPYNAMASKERSYLWHWEDNLHKHAKKCFNAHDQEEFKHRCHQWKNAPSKAT